MSRHPTCTCPDAAKGNVCKHLLFVMLRVLHMDSRDPVIWQRGLLSAEVQHIWEVSEQRSSAGALHTGVTASAALQAAYAASQAAAASPGAGGPPDRPVSGDCPICYDVMQPGGKTSAVSSQPCSHAAAVQYIVSVLCSAHALHVQGPPAVRHTVFPRLRVTLNLILRLVCCAGRCHCMQEVRQPRAQGLLPALVYCQMCAACPRHMCVLPSCMG